MSVFHSNTEMLIDYWRGLTFGAQAPRRADVDPAHFAPLAPQTLVLGRTTSGHYPVRLAGGLVRDLFDRDLRGVNALSLWLGRDHTALRIALEGARRRPEPLVVNSMALADSAMIEMEVLLAPLSGGPTGPDRYLVLLQPLSPLARLRDTPVRQLAVACIRSAGPANEPAPRIKLAAVNGRRIA